MSLLQVRNASKHFGRLVAVNDVSLVVQPGELRAVIGPNGAGKTTFFNLISGFFPPTSGAIVFDGEDITRLSEHRRVEMGMARTFQITEIFPELTAHENIRVAVEVAAGARLKPWLTQAARRRVAARVDELLEMGGISAMADRLVGELSHGDQRATEIMMSLALNPRLLLLDEPTAGMGDTESDHMVDLIRRLHQQEGVTILFIEHDMDIVFGIAQRITVLDQGRVLAEGTPDMISADPKVRAAYLGSTE